MSDFPPEDQFDDEPEVQEPPKASKLREALERAQAENAQLKQQATEVDALRKKLAVHEANLGSLNEDQQKAVLATSAEMTADALRSQAEKLGFVEPPAPPEEPAAFDRVQQATAGGNPTDAGTYEAELDAANNEAEMLAVMRKYGKPIKL